MKNSRDGFVDSTLIRIKDKLPDGGEKGMPEFHPGSGEESQAKEAARGDFYQKEHRKAIQKRIEEFRMLKSDLSGRITEKLAAIPEDVRISEARVSELRNAVEKFASILDTVKSLDESAWHEDNLSHDVGRSVKSLENARLDFIRISSRISALQRESEAAENSGPNSFLPEIRSLSIGQICKFGFFLTLPLILAFLLASVIIGIFIIATFRFGS